MTTPKSWRRTERNLLSATAFRNAKAHGRFRDGGGLFLEVDKNGRRWVYRAQADGKRREFGLGSAVDVGLNEARETADRYRADLRQGRDPIGDKLDRRATNAKATHDASIPTFKALAEEAHRTRAESWKNGKHTRQWLKTLEQHAYPTLGNMQVNAIERRHVLTVLAPIWHAKQETARRVRQRIETVMTLAKGKNLHAGDNPADRKIVTGSLGAQADDVKHHAALHYNELGAFIAALRSSECANVTKLGFEFLILTAARSGEATGARWSEIQIEEREWHIPAERMKAGVRHVVPLCDRAIAIMSEAKALDQTGDLVFPDPHTGKEMSENRFLNARDSAGYKDKCTPHGFRSTFKDWCTAQTNFKGEASERALAHMIKDGTEAAYARDNLIEMRHGLMRAWGSFAAGGVGGKVILMTVKANA